MTPPPCPLCKRELSKLDTTDGEIWWCASCPKRKELEPELLPGE